MPAAKFHIAIAKIEALARSKRAKQTTATLRSERVRDRQAYTSYLTSHTQDNEQGLPGHWVGSDSAAMHAVVVVLYRIDLCVGTAVLHNVDLIIGYRYRMCGGGHSSLD